LATRKLWVWTTRRAEDANKQQWLRLEPEFGGISRDCPAKSMALPGERRRFTHRSVIPMRYSDRMEHGGGGSPMGAASGKAEKGLGRKGWEKSSPGDANFSTQLRRTINDSRRRPGSSVWCRRTTRVQMTER
jgi:hypothetical protein